METHHHGDKAEYPREREDKATSSRDAVSISAARDWALVWVAKRFFAS